MNALEPFSAADTVAHGRGPENAPEAVLSRSSGIGGALASHNVSENLEDVTMGGFGSGRQSNRRTVEDVTRLDIRPLSGQMRPGNIVRVSGWLDVAVEDDVAWFLDYRHLPGELAPPRRYAIGLDRTPQRLGGTRVWWRCPACNGRCAVLYACNGVACRKCCQLVYKSQRETAEDRALRRAGKIRRRLGWPPGIVNPPGGKPRWMHWRRFGLLVTEHNLHAARALAGMGEWIAATQTRLKAMRR